MEFVTENWQWFAAAAVVLLAAPALWLLEGVFSALQSCANAWNALAVRPWALTGWIAFVGSILLFGSAATMRTFGGASAALFAIGALVLAASGGRSVWHLGSAAWRAISGPPAARRG